MNKTALLLTAAAALVATSVAAQETIAPGANVSVVFDQELPLRDDLIILTPEGDNLQLGVDPAHPCHLVRVEPGRID